MSHQSRDAEAEAAIVAVSGYRDTGKTTAIEGIVRELTRRGYRVGTLKHCHHGYDLDRRGKDSWRHLQAGATGTLLVSPTGYAFLSGRPAEKGPAELAAHLFPDTDLVVVEGFHWLPLARVAVEERNGQIRPANEDGEVVARLPYHFTAREIVALCDLLEARYLKTGRGPGKSAESQAAD